LDEADPPALRHEGRPLARLQHAGLEADRGSDRRALVPLRADRLDLPAGRQTRGEEGGLGARAGRYGESCLIRSSAFLRRTPRRSGASLVSRGRTSRTRRAVASAAVRSPLFNSTSQRLSSALADSG